jgi:hypothetical protein
MRRIIAAVPLAVLAILLPTWHAQASPGVGACPPGATGFVRYPIVGEIGDPAPARGEEPLWDMAEDGVLAEGFSSLEEFIEFFGFESVDDLYTFALAGWLEVDKNGDRLVCVREFPPQQNGSPAYYFLFRDNVAQVPN